jgi:rhodanese-related sulfurtransferase
LTHKIVTTYETIVPVIVYCGSGKRAAKAKEVLEGKGYLKVLNAGAFGDLTYLRQE